MTLIRRFAEDRSGATAMLFGLCIIPVMAGVGAAVDYARAANVRTGLQMAVDSTALLLARDLGSESDPKLGEYARKAFKANFRRKDATLGTISAERVGKAIRVSADATVKTTMMSLFHIDTIQVAATGTVGWSPNKIELALVLDNTNSMSRDGKMVALKQALGEFFDYLETSVPDKDAIKISLVPFDTQVNVGTSFRNADWLTYNADLDRKLRVNRADWQGCIADRDRAYDVNDRQDGGSLSLYPAAKCATGSLAKIQPLTKDYRALRQTVRDMSPSGNTNLTVGIAWGLATLSKAAPFEQAVAFDTKQVSKIMIVLTDGDNTENRWDDVGDARNNAQRKEIVKRIDDRTELVCRDVKEKEIQVYTVRVIAGNADLLRGCATTTDMYKQVESATELAPLFRELAKKIAGIRLTS